MTVEQRLPPKTGVVGIEPFALSRQPIQVGQNRAKNP